MVQSRRNTRSTNSSTNSPAVNVQVEANSAPEAIPAVAVAVGQETAEGPMLPVAPAEEDTAMGASSDSEFSSSSLSTNDGDSFSSSSSHGVDMDGDQIMEDATETVVEHSDLGSRQLPEATVVHGCENKPAENVIVDESVSLEQIERSILQCDRRIAEYVVQITQLNLTDPVRAEELRQLHDVQFKDRRRFTLARDLIMKSRDSSSSLSTKVPNNLPRIQWVNHVFDHSAEVFSTIADALRKFKDVLLMHGLNPDYHWRRLITGSRNVWYRLIHHKIPFRSLLHRFMPDFFPSPTCLICSHPIEDY